MDKEFKFTRDDFDYLRNIVFNETGIISDQGKYTMYYSRLARRVRKLGLKDFIEYRRFLNNNKNTEIIELINAVTTNLTSFFREEHHFEFLKESYIPEKIKNNDNKVRIWSAACSTGEEPYSIAIALLEAIPNIKSWDVQIIATDIDSNVVNTAIQGVYGIERVESLDKVRLKRFMKKGTGNNSGFIKVNKEISELIKFEQLNLLKQWPFRDSFDLIFCRNVVIYFDNETKIKLVDRFHSQLQNNGFLLMGHSESLHNVSDQFKLLGKTIYQKV